MSAAEETHLKTPLMSTATQDPFYVVKDELVRSSFLLTCLPRGEGALLTDCPPQAGKLESILKRVEKFNDLLWNTNTSGNGEFKEVKKGLSREIKGAEGQLKDLELTVEYVERDRSAFAHIDDRELEERRGFVATARGHLTTAREAVWGEKAKRKIDDDEKAHLAATRGNYGAQSDIEMANTDFIHQQHAETRTIMREQDDNLEVLDGAVDRVHRMAQEIHGELKTQSRLIDDLEQEIDETSEKMNFVMGKLAKLLKTKDSCQLWTIVILTLVLIIMILVLIWS